VGKSIPLFSDNCRYNGYTDSSSCSTGLLWFCAWKDSRLWFYDTI